VISVISVAAVFRPPIIHATPKPSVTSYDKYSNPADRDLMAEKMRIILRTAIRNQHRQIVLGALGCGAFQNPPVEVAMLWKKVLTEPEFGGGWWEDVVFAVLSGNNDGNFDIFQTLLDGLVV
jgi:uncharacterized protein (TIGR02452 family)